MRAYKFLPNNAVHNHTHQYTLVNELDATILHLEKYSKYCLKNESKNHEEAAGKLANILIDHVMKNPDSKMSLIELVSINMSLLFPFHKDSVDSRAMGLYLQNKLVEARYMVISAKPFRMKKVS